MIFDYRKGKVLFLATFTLLVLTTFAVFSFYPSKRNNLKTKDAENVEPVQEKVEKKYMEFDDFLNGRFRASSFYPHWVSGNEYVAKTAEKTFVKINIDTEAERTFLEGDVVPENIDSWVVSPDQLYIAIHYNRTDGYAHYMRTVSTKVIEVATGMDASISDFPGENIQQFKWSSTGHAFAYVSGFNVYLVKDFSTAPHQLSTDGDEQLQFNGVADWLFSGEITDDNALLWWSSESSYLAYAKINQTGVLPIEFSVYKNLQYPEMVKLPYPKAGTPIPYTKLIIVNITSLEQIEIIPSHHVSMMWNDEYYLNSAVWRADDLFTPTWKNRVENSTLPENCVAPSFSCNHAHAMMESSDTGWVGHYKVSHIYPSPNRSEYFTVQSMNNFPHIVRIIPENNTKDQRTSGEFEVTDTGYGYTSIYNYDDVFDWIYFTSTEMEESLGQGLPRIRHMWRVKGHGTNKTRECITCRLNTDYKDRCNWVTPTFSKNGSFVVVNCGGTGNGVPISTLHKKNDLGDFDFVRVVENNNALLETLKDYYFRERKFGTIGLPNVEGQWYYTLHTPPNFDPNKKYPMLVQVYSGIRNRKCYSHSAKFGHIGSVPRTTPWKECDGLNKILVLNGPGFQEVEDRYSVSWKDYISSSSMGIVFMSFDGRGTGFRGDEIMHMVYKKLGQYEPMDQISAARIVAEENSYIDVTKKAIWGWSYGGYSTAKTIAEDSEGVFKCGFAVAPVTDWNYYHSIYTERYMLQPNENPDGYEASSTMKNVTNFKKHWFSVFHGTRDENVHFQNSAQLTKTLIDKDVDFRAFYAADDDHSMSLVPNNYRNLYKKLTKQLKICFNLE